LHDFKRIMGIFSFFNTKGEEESTVFPWIKITDVAQLEAIVSKSYENPIVIFKHSTSCGISRMVLRNFEKEYPNLKGTKTLYYLDLLAYRSLSNEIAQKFQVVHQSPQVLVIKDGKAVFNASHHSIDAELIEQIQ